MQKLIATVLPFDDGILLLNFVGTRMSRYCLSAKLSKQIQPQLLAEGLKVAPPWQVIAANPGIRYISGMECFGTEEASHKSEFHHTFLAPYGWTHPLAIVFWENHEVLAGLCLFRSTASGTFTNEDRTAFDTLYDDIHVGLQRILKLYRETTHKLNMSDLLGQWITPCILLDWELKNVRPAGGRFGKRVPASVMKSLIYHKSVINETLAHGEPLERSRIHLDTVEGADWTARIYLLSANHDGLMPPWWLVEFQDTAAPSPNPAINPDHELSPRETDVVRCVAKGLGNQAIGQRLDISEGTVKRHLHNIHRKVGSRSKLELIALLREENHQ